MSVLKCPRQNRINPLWKFSCACCPPCRWCLNEHIATFVLQILLLCCFYSNCLLSLLRDVTSCLRFNWDRENCSRTWLLQANKQAKPPLLVTCWGCCFFDLRFCLFVCFSACCFSVLSVLYELHLCVLYSLGGELSFYFLLSVTSVL